MHLVLVHDIPFVVTFDYVALFGLVVPAQMSFVVALLQFLDVLL